MTRDPHRSEPDAVAKGPSLRGLDLRTVRERVRRRLVRTYRDQTTRGIQQPSFNYKVLEATRTRMQLRDYGFSDPAFSINRKDATHAWLARLGVRSASLLASYDSPEQIEWDALPERCVVKPARGNSSTGVYLLVRHGDGWREIAQGRELSSAALGAELTALFEDGTVRGPVLVEELVDDPRAPEGGPIDYKVHTFFGRAGLIEAKLRLPDGTGEPISWWCIYDDTWSPIGNAFNDLHYNGSIPPPHDPQGLLNIACRVSSAIPRPYLRVDLMEDSAGPLVCELTPEPGGVVMVRSDLDRRLGRLWEDADVRLRVRAIRAGLLEPVVESLAESSISLRSDLTSASGEG